MPTGGQIAGGTGLSLQPTTPGVAERGNAHLTGAMLVEGTLGAAGGMVTAGGVRQRVAIVGEGVTIPFPQQTMGNSGPVALGSDSAVGQTSRGWTSQMESVAIGNTAKASSRGSTVIGWGANCDTGTAGINCGFNVIIGRSCSLTSSTAQDRGQNVCVGANGSFTRCDNLVAIGFSINAGNKGNNISPLGKSSVLIGAGIKSSNGINQIIVSSEFNGAALADETRDDIIKIGDASHFTIEIGGRDFTKTQQVRYLMAESVRVAENTVVETNLLLATPSGGKVVKPADWNGTMCIRVTARGIISTTGTPTLELKTKLGAIDVCDTGAQVLPAMAAGNHLFEYESIIHVAGSPSPPWPVHTHSMFRVPGTSVELTSFVYPTMNVDATLSYDLNVSAQWGTADPANSIRITTIIMEIM